MQSITMTMPVTETAPLAATSWWFDDAMAHDPSPASPPLNGHFEADVAIVGGGFTGLWTALLLKEKSPGLRIALIEAGSCGSGASGKNGGKVHGYWSALPGIAATLGPDVALAIARAGSKAQDGVRAFATTPGRDVWWREAGNIRVSAAPAQDVKIETAITCARELGVPDSAVPLSPQDVAARIQSPVFRAGVFYPEAANVHPARLARALRSATLENGVEIFENTPMTRLDRGTPNRITTPSGEIQARHVVLATNVSLATEPEIAPHLTLFSSYALMTEPNPDALARMHWTGGQGVADFRMFVHYFRATRDGRVLMGSGSGPISHTGDERDPALTMDAATAARAVSGLRRLLPTFNASGVVKVWGGGIDISADRLPFFKTMPSGTVHYGAGYSGHGVNATYIGGQCLSSLVLGRKDEWTNLPFCTRDLPRLPREPFRTWGGRAIRASIMACEEAEERNQRAAWPLRSIAALPRAFGLKIGTR
jgi:glycine/D-amino acid oxidase-like deaminating enzyme